ncbi:hypothetical protein KCP71_21915 [Salmonella enterica subsp. enterica]|nr:hypothetical protein KCP71_21915 [Salmonella enterica subsp. enterica]
MHSATNGKATTTSNLTINERPSARWGSFRITAKSKNRRFSRLFISNEKRLREKPSSSH